MASTPTRAESNALSEGRMLDLPMNKAADRIASAIELFATVKTGQGD